MIYARMGGALISSSWVSSPSNLPFERRKHLLSISILVATLCACFPHMERLEEHWYWETWFQGHDSRIGNSGIWLVLSPHLSLHFCYPGMGPCFPFEDNSHRGKGRIKAGTDSCTSAILTGEAETGPQDRRRGWRKCLGGVPPPPTNWRSPMGQLKALTPSSSESPHISVCSP